MLTNADHALPWQLEAPVAGADQAGFLRGDAITTFRLALTGWVAPTVPSNQIGLRSFSS